MTCVDPWVPQPGNDQKIGGDDYAGWDHEGNYKNFCKAVAAKFPDRVKIHRMFSREGAKQVEDGSLDFVFIDACHSYDACVDDIKAWSPKVRKGGLIAGHDFNWPTVYKAVMDTGGCEGRAADNVWLKFKENK